MIILVFVSLFVSCYDTIATTNHNDIHIPPVCVQKLRIVWQLR